MEKNEPSLIPEWLKNAGSTGNSSARSDDRAPPRLTRNRSVNTNTNINYNIGNNNGRELGRSFSSDRTTSSYFLRSSGSNGSGNLRSQSSSRGRNHHDREWSSKEKPFLGERWRRESPDSLKTASSFNFDRDVLRRSQSMTSAKRGDTWHRKDTNDSDYYGGRNKNGPIAKNSPTGGPKMNFARDFPSLGSEERTSSSDVITRVPSPVFSSSSIQSLPIGISPNVGGEKWKSALAEVPGLVGSNGMMSSSSSSQHVASGNNTTGLNMAEAVAHGPIDAQASPQLSVGTQRCGELSLKQSKQLIPVTPSLQKSLAKPGPHPVQSQPTNSPRGGGPAKGEAPKPKLHILKPARESNSASPTTLKEKLLSPTGSNKPLSPRSSIADPKTIGTVLEKRPTSQARSRNDFFNTVRKKSMGNSTTDFSPFALETVNIADLSVPDEAEAAFLRSLGWEEDSDEGGLTEEEISAFFRDAASKYVDSKMTLKALQDLKLEIPYDPRVLDK